MVQKSLRVAMICTGNICRSPMAEVILHELVTQDKFLRPRVSVSSAGTARWHVGSPMDSRARSALDRAGFHGPGTLGAYASSEYLDAHDVVVVMTREHRDDVQARLSNENTEVILLRNLLEPGLDLDVPDPYYGQSEDFDACVDLFTRGGQRLITEFRQQLGADSRAI